ncbi:DUF692 domain-containing protein [Oceanicoccus sagamiensis]|uniref:UPF0276 protein BST96_14895 n=1 Tax=Oceanicoccus sagamiensis TaxID=716816 RepID=A0A1X9NKA4_9GAMM|nr:DUF692 domain-containing protein [Oceanicoccus sagamiensis]ARN75287.1 hypothetical protein BST96_14895 [Oceanicoccus sagamiensis]
MNDSLKLNTAGLGLRRALMQPLADLPDGALDFMEVAPENWINLGGRLKKQFRQYSERYPIHLHGLSLNIGGVAPLDEELLQSIKAFMDEHQCPIYTEHLTYCGDDGHLYDLMPIPFTEEAVKHVAERVKRVQDVLGRRIALENASYYCAPDQQMSESDFINAVLAEADCDLLLDVNNIYVNSINHSYDPYQFLTSLPLQKARYIHIAGHYDEAEDLRVDTHGADVIDPVWDILKAAYQHCGPLPTLLERDFNFPAVEALMAEVAMIRSIQAESKTVPKAVNQ